jgi:hypothetical protein
MVQPSMVKELQLRRCAKREGEKARIETSSIQRSRFQRLGSLQSDEQNGDERKNKEEIGNAIGRNEGPSQEDQT